MAHFTQDNTEGYSDAELAELNTAYDAILSDKAEALAGMVDDGLARESYKDHLAERLLVAYDAGLRGDALRA